WEKTQEIAQAWPIRRHARELQLGQPPRRRGQCQFSGAVAEAVERQPEQGQRTYQLLAVAEELSDRQAHLTRQAAPEDERLASRPRRQPAQPRLAVRRQQVQRSLLEVEALGI